MDKDKFLNEISQFATYAGNYNPACTVVSLETIKLTVDKTTTSPNQIEVDGVVFDEEKIRRLRGMLESYDWERQIYCELLRRQKPLDPEFAKIVEEGIFDLYIEVEPEVTVVQVVDEKGEQQ